MNTTRKAYTYKMNLVPANILGIVIFIVLIVLTILLRFNFQLDLKLSLFLLLMFIYLGLHEICHGLGYLLGGAKRKNIVYGIALEKGILYCQAFQEITKKNILISLQMPFILIGVITYIIGILLNIPILVYLSIINLIGASMDIMMFIYILKLPKNTIYSESGEPDEFVLISTEDLTKKKSIYFKIVNVKEYKKEDYKFKNIKKLTISQQSYIVVLILLILGVLSII